MDSKKIKAIGFLILRSIYIILVIASNCFSNFIPLLSYDLLWREYLNLSVRSARREHLKIK